MSAEGFLVICILICAAAIGGCCAGRGQAERRIMDEAVKAGAAYYQHDPGTAVGEFTWREYHAPER